MHIPDGFITNPWIWGGCYALAGSAVAVAVRQTRQEWQDRAPLLPAMTGAFLFAAQIFNFPIAGGTSGHLLGGVLACALLGGWGGVLVTSLVLVVQCLLFQDGGITALGANVFNIAVIGGGGGFLLYHALSRLARGPGSRHFALGMAAAMSVMLAALLAAVEIGLSGTVPLATVVGAMALMHLPIALVEGVATYAVVGALVRLRPELARGYSQVIPLRHWAVAGCAILALTLVAIKAASSAPDALEQVALRLGFADHAYSAHAVPFPDYALLHQDSYLAGATASLIGLLVVGLLGGLLARRLRRSGGAASG